MWKTFLVYIDDAIVLLNLVEEYLLHVAKILRILKSARMSLKWSKCEFFCTTASDLSHVLKRAKLEIKGFGVISL